jgi:hypothetical protein
MGMARKKSFKTTISWELQIALIKLQGRMESTYEEACIRASQLLNPNSKEFEKAVADEVSRFEKSQIMRARARGSQDSASRRLEEDEGQGESG